ncbi:MAG: ribosomal-protein-alanine N-acetyltransferase [Betaproteobacteria bacterium]|nr:ribosomal-protein-alanine N-acetyltransferase [Betaproteobacteria bacterium]
MRSQDLTDVVRLETSLYAYPWTLGNFKDSLSAGYSCWAMMEAEHLIGHAVMMMGVEETHLLNLSVRSDRQRQGLGGRLMAHLIEVSRACEARKMLLEVRRSNETAREFYRVKGFDEIGERPGYYPVNNGREDAIVMEKPL